MINEQRIIKWGQIAQSKVDNRGNGDRNNMGSKIITEMQEMKLEMQGVKPEIWSKNRVS